MQPFSVLMSVYFKEHADFLDLALSSILDKQTLRPNEVILVCDGPLTLELDKVIAKYEGSNNETFKVYRLKENGGLGKALNYGLKKCSYELVARADSDDVCAETRFEKQIAYMETHPDVAVLGSEITEFDADPSMPKNYKQMPADSDSVYKLCLFRCPVNHMTVMFRKSVILEVGSYVHLQYIEDYYLWVRVLAAGYKIENIKEALVAARVGSGMVQRRGSKAYIKSWHILNVYMKKHNMIGNILYMRNMLSLTAFVFMPVGLKTFIYKYVLRKQ